MKKILVIEDNQLVRDSIAEMLTVANYLVFTAENGRSGIALALQELPHLIICDIKMPEMDGYAVLQWLNNHTVLQHIPFIFVTGDSEEAGIRKAMEMGADDYITKPFQRDELLKVIKNRIKW